MAKLNMKYTHNLPVAEVKVRVLGVFDEYKEKFNMNCKWNGDQLVLSGLGFTGTVDVGANDVLLDAKLGLPASLFSAAIEKRLMELLQQTLKG